MTEGDIRTILLEIAREEMRRDKLVKRIAALDAERATLSAELREKEKGNFEDPRWAQLRELVRPIIEELKLIV